jgi:hypothetical protein
VNREYHFRVKGNPEEIRAYRKVIDLDDSGEIAERARTALREKWFLSVHEAYP